MSIIKPCMLAFVIAVQVAARPPPLNGVSTKSDTLLVYIFSDGDPVYVENFDYFVSNGLSGAVDYVFVLQRNPYRSDMTRLHLKAILRKLPSNAIVLHHENKCYDTGTFGWALAQPEVSQKVASYKYYIMLNSSVRGPLLQPFFPRPREWHRLLIRKFGGPTHVHLVGATISCEGTYSAKRKATRHSPHVQSWLLALDRTGLATVAKDGRPFQCHEDHEDAVWNGEVGTSKLMLQSGFNIACLLAPYQGVDWRQHSNHQCNGKKNPMSGHNFYGTNLSPFATVFTKFKQNQNVLERSDSMYESYVHSTGMLTLEGRKSDV